MAVREKTPRTAAGAAERSARGAAKSTKPARSAAKMQKVVQNRSKLLVSIVNKKDERRLKEIVDDVSVSLTVSFEGTGTAHSHVLDYLGIGETEKTVALSLFPESDEARIMRELREKMALYLVGRGISFTVPLTGISQLVADGIARGAAEKPAEEGRMTEENRKYDLVVAAVAAGFAEEAMEAARAVGAAGGTVIHAHAQNNAKAEQFIGVSLMEEQDILLILTPREGKRAIMQALLERVGLKTQAGGIVVSVPVDQTAGIAAADAAHGEAVQADGKKGEA